MFTWSHVKFLECETVANVPTSYFKDIVNKTVRDPSDLKVGKVYSVFWSPVPMDNPQDLISRGNEIIDVDRIPKRHRLKQGPLKGYYQAALLDLRTSEDTSDNLSKVSSTNATRVKVPSRKVMETLTSGGPTKHQMDKVSTTAMKQKQAKMAAEAASKANILGLLEKCSGEGSQPSKKRKDSSSSDPSECSSESDDEERNTSWEEKYKTLMKILQQNEEMPQAKKSKKKKHEKSSRKAKKSRTDRNNDLHENTKSAANDKFKLMEPEEKLDYSVSEPDQDAVKPETSRTGDVGDGVSEHVLISDDRPMVMQKRRRPKSGRDGDSLFVMNEALHHWSHKTLAIRSATGLAQSRKDTKDRPGYPKMTPEKVAKISEGLTTRIREDNPNITAEEFAERKGKLHYYLGQRVSASRRALKGKGINIPNHDNVLKVIASDPNSDGTAAYNAVNRKE